MKITQYFCISFFFLLLLSCEKENPEVLPEQTSSPTAPHTLTRISDSCRTVLRKEGKYAESKRNNFFIRYFESSSCGSSPLIIAIHGGSFIQGAKEDMLPNNLNKTLGLIGMSPVLTEEQLSNHRIAYATINYRFLNTSNNTRLATPLNDCKAFVDYIRAHAEEYNIDPNRIILMGFSAGASSALWLGLQDPSIKGIIAFSPQASLNIIRWHNDVFQPFGMNKLAETFNFLFSNNPSMAQNLYGTTNLNQIHQYSNQHNLHLLDLMDNSDPELWLATALGGDLVHNAAHVYRLKQKAQQVGLPATVGYINEPFFVNPQAESITQFCVRKFGQ